MKIVLLNIAAAALLALTISSCGKKSGGVDKKAAEACAVNEKSNPASEDGDACKTCCENDSSGTVTACS